MFRSSFFNLLSSAALAAFVPFQLFGSTIIQANICSLPPTAPSFTTASASTTDTTYLISGTSSDNTAITVSDNDQQVASLTSDSTGDFSLQVSLSLGSNSFSAAASNVCGSVNSTGSLVITRTSPPPVSSSANSSTPTTNTTASTPASSSVAKSAVTSGNPASNTPSSTPNTSSSSASTSPDLVLSKVPSAASSSAGSSTTANSVFISGSSTPGATITILDNGKHVARLTAGPDGSFGVSLPLSDNKNSLTIAASYNGKTTSQTITFIRTATILNPAHKSSATLVVGIILLIVGMLIMYYGLRLLLLGKKRLKQEEETKASTTKSINPDHPGTGVVVSV